jgi:hypothetical protein
LAIFQESWGEAGAYCVGGINRTESCCAEHINRGASSDRDRAHAEVPQALMERSEITPGGGAEARSAGDGGSTGKPCALQRFGDALAVRGALTELRCRARGDRRVEALAP